MTSHEYQAIRELFTYFRVHLHEGMGPREDELLKRIVAFGGTLLLNTTRDAQRLGISQNGNLFVTLSSHHLDADLRGRVGLMVCSSSAVLSLLDTILAGEIYDPELAGRGFVGQSVLHPGTPRQAGRVDLDEWLTPCSCVNPLTGRKIL